MSQPIKSISVVMPAYNEAGNIQGMVEDMVWVISPLTDDQEIIIVDDGSRDDTVQLIKSLQPLYPTLRLVQHEVNRGYGAAVFDGLTSAEKEWIFLTDSDRQFDLREIYTLLAFTQEGDVIIGYRAPRRDALLRKLNGWGWSLLVALLFGYTARDIDCAFKLIRRTVIEGLSDKIASRGATFSAELLVRAKRSGYRIREVPIRGHQPRLAGSPTGARLHVIVRAFQELFRFRIVLWREGQTTSTPEKVG